MAAPHWQERREAGSRFMLRFIRWLGLRVSPRAAHALLYPVTLYFLVMRGPERRASRAYLSRVFGCRATLLQTARHIYTFAVTILDRVFFLAGRFEAERVRVHGLPELHRHLDAGRGVLLLGAHFGSFDAVRTLAFSRPELTVRILMDYGHNAQLSAVLNALNPRAEAGIIDASGDSTQVLLQIYETLAAGGMVGVLADRARPGEATRACSLLGTPAALPIAPFRLAAVLGCPVMLMFGVLRENRFYDIYFEPFADRIVLGPRSARDGQLASWLKRYAERLEARVREAPYNWFNFYDFWFSDDDLPQDAHSPIAQP